MNPRGVKFAAVGLLICAGLVALVLVFRPAGTTRRRSGEDVPTTDVPGGLAQVDSSRSARSVSESRSDTRRETERGFEAAGPPAAGVSSVAGLTTDSATGSESGGDANAEPTPIDLATCDLFDAAVLNRLLREHNGAAALYRNLPEHQREDLVSALWAEGKLREEIGNLLPLARDSAERASMLAQTHPRESDFDSEEVDLSIDDGLKAVLDKDPGEAIGSKEMLARMRLAFEIDPRYGEAWARRALREFPQDYRVQVRGQSQILKASTGREDVSAQERGQARDALVESSRRDEWAALPVEDRVDAYYAMFADGQSEEARSFFRRQLERETDEDAREVLTALLELLEGEK